MRAVRRGIMAALIVAACGATAFGPSARETFRPEIDERKVKTMDDEAKRNWIESEAEKRTGRLEVKLGGTGKLTRYDAKSSKLVLLRDFIERFDRTFLPVAELACP